MDRNQQCCVECGAPIRDPFLTGGLEVCEHRKACEGRQMLKAGADVMDAARHAQGLGGGGFWEEMVSMEARSVVRDRMRGDRGAGRRGDTGPSAVLVACTATGITDHDAALELLPYAYGFALALNGLPLDTGGLCWDHVDGLVLDGFLDGGLEDRGRVWPAAVSVHGEPVYGGKLIDR